MGDHLNRRSWHFFSFSATVPILAAIICLGLFCGDARAETYVTSSTINVDNQLNGGDCYLVGQWDGGTETCTLTKDIVSSAAVGVDVKGGSYYYGSYTITFDGNGHSVSGHGTEGIRVLDSYPLYPMNTQVKNLDIKGWYTGIQILSGARTSIFNNRIYNNSQAIESDSTGYGTISNNFIGGNFVAGIHLKGSTNNEIEGNTINASGGAGILFSSVERTSWPSEGGPPITYTIHSSDNTIYGNNFVGNLNDLDISAEDTALNNFFQPAPQGGNYWDRFDQPAEGCVDGNGDSFCDAPYGPDALPLASPNALISPPEDMGNGQPTGDIPEQNRQNLLYIANGQASEIKVVDVGTLAIVGTIPVPHQIDWLAPIFYWEVSGVAPSQDRSSVYAVGDLSADRDSFNVFEINAATGAEVRRIGMDDSLIGYGSLEYDRNDESSDNLIAANLQTGDEQTANIEQIFGLPPGSLPSGPGGWAEVSLSTGAQTNYISTDFDGDSESSTAGIAWDSTGTRAYASLMYQPSIVTMDWNTRTPDSQIVAPVAQGNIHQSTTAKSRGLLFNAAGTDGIAVFDMATESFIGSISTFQILGGIHTDVHGVEIAPGNDDILYVVARGDPTYGYASLLVLDVSDINAPVLLGIVPGLDGNASGVYAIADKQEYYGTQPGLSITKDSVYWASMDDYQSGILSVDYSVDNSGPDAKDVSLVGTVNTAGVISVNNPSGAQDITGGSNGNFTVRYSVPPSVASFISTVYAQAQNGAGIFEYPGPYPGP